MGEGEFRLNGVVAYWDFLSQKEPTRQRKDWNQDRQSELQNVSKEGGHPDLGRFRNRLDHEIRAIADIGSGTKENGAKGYRCKCGWILYGKTGDLGLVEEMKNGLMEVQGEGEEC